MPISEILLQILLGSVAGAFGQGLRLVIGLKKSSERAASEGMTLADNLDVNRIFIGLLIGAIAGGLGILSLTGFEPVNNLSSQLFFTLIGIGYAGTDFIEGLIRKYIPKQVDAGDASTQQRSSLGVAQSTIRVDELNVVRGQVQDLREIVDKLQYLQLRGGDVGLQYGIGDLLSVKKYVPVTADGWMLVIMAGTRTALPSGLAVTITSQSASREFGIIEEGLYSGKTFDISQGNLNSIAERKSNVVAVFDAAPSPVVIGDKTYDRRLTISWTENGASKSAGPFPSMTDPANPISAGTHDIEIADFPHDLGKPYGEFGTVWFRIGHRGDRYIHPGHLSEGCVTCAPNNWPVIYKVLNYGRLGDGKSVGKLKVI